MANAGASIEAVLTLNASGFTSGITESTNALNKFITATDKLKTGNASKGIEQLERAFVEFGDVLQRVDALNNQSINTFSKVSTAVNKMANGLRILQSEEVDVVQGVNTMNSIFQAFQGALNGTTVKLQGVATAEREVATASRTSMEAQLQAINTLNSNRNSVMSLITGKNQLSNSEKQVATSTNQASTSLEKESTAMTQASAKANQLTSATNRLKSAMSSLRMIGNLVGSMLAYNFAHKLLVATGETIHAKSEMEGYFKMLNFGQSDIDHFNQALDRTVSQFQRVNKYSLGETISSIGVEFNLTTQEMEKAMKVTSMITSEYLRAGRNANEASLAVKDVLQGQFQRLSRETGVKGEQLKEAGWSGDTTDVLGLMEALEKVGESRNWDVFAEKANSLNDILTITQNRFGEWSADMVYTVQPAIVGTFNMILGTAQKLGGVLEGLWKWLNADGLENNIAKWTLLGGAIATVLSIVVAYRTGAGLLQVAQMGIVKTLASTVLGLEAETVALYGTKTAIYSKIFGLEAEKVAELSVRDAIASKILGLDAELVAQTSVKDAIIDSAFARELEQMRLSGATAEEMLNTLALYENQLAQKSTIGLLSAQAMGLNMTTYATHGFTVALLEAKTGMDATKLASMNLLQKIALLGASMVVPTAIVGAFAVALGTLALKMNDSAKQMEKFNDLVKNGSSIIQENKDSVETYTKRQEDLNNKLSEAKEGTVEYYEIQNKLLATNKDLATANANLENSIKAVELATSSQKHYEEALTDMSIEHQGKLAEAYMNAGYSAQKAYEMANESLLDAQNGAEQLRITLQKIKQLQEKGESNTNYLLGVYQGNGIDLNDPETKKHLNDAVTLNEKMQDSLEKGLTDDSFMGRIDGWLGYYQYQLESWINNIGATVQAGDWGAIFENVWKGIAHGFADLPIFKDFWGWVFDNFNIKESYGGKGWDGLKQFFTDSFSNFLNMFNPLEHLGKDSWGWDPVRDLNEWIYNSVKNFDLGKTVMDALTKSSWGWDPLADFYNWLLDTLGGLDNLDISGLLNNIFTSLDFFGKISEAFSNLFSSDGTGGGSGITPLMIDLPALFQNLLNFANMDFSWIPSSIDTYVISPIRDGLVNGIMNIPILGTVISLLATLLGANSDAQDKGSQIARAFQNALENIISNIPILSDILRILGLIPQANPTASSNGQGVGNAIKTGFKSGLTGIVDIIRNELEHIINTIGSYIDTAKQKASELGNAIVSGVRNAIDPGSPGIIAREIIGNEFGTFIPQMITDNAENVYSVAQSYGQRIVDGVSSVNFNSFDTMATDYQTDAQDISATTQMLGMDTTTAFNDMALAVNTVTGTMGTNVASTYTSMQTKQMSSLDTMKQKNTTAFNDMYTKSNQSLIQMRDSTSNITHQMTNAWSHMKDQIVATANQLKTESTNHFNQLSNTIGSFYRKIQNPSNWGSAGSPSLRQGARKPSSGKRIASSIKSRGGYAGGSTGYRGASTMSVAQLKKVLCPNGDCGNLFDGLSSTDKIDVDTFLKSVGGEHGFGWNTWKGTHYNYIKDKSDQWDMKSPTIQLKGGIPTNSTFKVGDFENGQPKISFDEFEGMARAIFTAIPYRFYYDSSWKGSWLGALQAGACNCWDGANALVAFASTCGFSGSIAHGSWNGIPHVWAVIEGRKMDTTGMQQRGTWTPSASAGSPFVRSAVHNSSSNTSSESNISIRVVVEGDVYGIDDLNSKIEDGIDRGLEKHFNKSYAVGI